MINIIVGIVIIAIEIPHFLEGSSSGHSHDDSDHAGTHSESSDGHGVPEFVLVAVSVFVFSAMDAYALFVHVRKQITDSLTKHHIYNMSSLLVLVVYNTVIDFSTFFDDHLRIFAFVRTTTTLLTLLGILAFIKWKATGSVIRISDRSNKAASSSSSSAVESA